MLGIVPDTHHLSNVRAQARALCRRGVSPHDHSWLPLVTRIPDQHGARAGTLLGALPWLLPAAQPSSSATPACLASGTPSHCWTQLMRSLHRARHPEPLLQALGRPALARQNPRRMRLGERRPSAWGLRTSAANTQGQRKGRGTGPGQLGQHQRAHGKPNYDARCEGSLLGPREGHQVTAAPAMAALLPRPVSLPPARCRPCRGCGHPAPSTWVESRRVGSGGGTESPSTGCSASILRPPCLVPCLFALAPQASQLSGDITHLLLALLSNSEPPLFQHTASGTVPRPLREVLPLASSSHRVPEVSPWSPAFCSHQLCSPKRPLQPQTNPTCPPALPQAQRLLETARDVALSWGHTVTFDKYLYSLGSFWRAAILQLLKSY